MRVGDLSTASSNRSGRKLVRIFAGKMTSPDLTVLSADPR
jgi:hypothetical protein